MLVRFRSPAVNRKPWVTGIPRIRRVDAVNTPTALDAAFFRCHAAAQRRGHTYPILTSAAEPGASTAARPMRAASGITTRGVRIMKRIPKLALSATAALLAVGVT